MLNRRILRIKAMQSLYGFYTTRESLIQVVRDGLKEKYTPHALTHDMSDTEEIDEHRKLALKLYDENLKLKKITPDEAIPDEVFDAASNAIDNYYREVKNEIGRTKKIMLESTRTIQRDYYKLLMLPGEFQFIEKLDKEKKEKALVPKNEVWKYHFIENPIIDALNTCQALQKEITANKLSWQEQSSDLKTWYRDIIRKEEAIIAYQQKANPTKEEHLQAVVDLFKKVLFKNEIIEEYWEEDDIRWSENRTILKSMVVKTLQEYSPENEEPFELKMISINEEDDFEFFELIYDGTIKEDAMIEGLIAQRTKNWDVTRLAMTDRIILKLAVAEMIYCRSIPVKVTINEFIEICKLYSTPKSKQFVNGILDVMANQLTSEGVIKKTGRGLIDNK
jgi:N utilization substance protein B